MILYHGSNIEVKEPRIIVSNKALDFGSGLSALTFSKGIKVDA